MPTDPCEIEMQAYADTAGIYVDAMVESAIQYAESLQASADCDTAWQNWSQADWNLSYCRDLNGYGASQNTTDTTEEPARVKTARQISRIRQAARKAAGVEYVERITDALGEADGKFTESQKLRLTEAREVLMKAMR